MTCSQKSDVPHINSSMYFLCNSIIPIWFIVKLYNIAAKQEEKLNQERINVSEITI